MFSVWPILHISASGINSMIPGSYESVVIFIRQYGLTSTVGYGLWTTSSLKRKNEGIFKLQMSQMSYTSMRTLRHSDQVLFTKLPLRWPLWRHDHAYKATSWLLKQDLLEARIGIKYMDQHSLQMILQGRRKSHLRSTWTFPLIALSGTRSTWIPQNNHSRDIWKTTILRQNQGTRHFLMP
jgi:hypothetical protein